MRSGKGLIRTRMLSVVAALVVCLAIWATLAGARGANGYPLNPVRGIGPVAIHESKTNVERALHWTTPPCPANCLRTYSSPRGGIQVNYVHARVRGIGSTSPQITLGGLPLGLGPKRLRHQLRRWRYSSCQGYVFGHGPSTSVAFGRHGSVDINVVAGRIGRGCAAP
jgi:hypothetical protein